MLLLASLELENVAHPILWLLLLGLGAAALGFTYLGIFRRSESRLAWLLLSLRVAGIAALLAALVRPVWTHTARLVDPGRLAIVLDDSLSMSLAASNGERRYDLAKASALKLRSQIEGRRDNVEMAVDLLDLNGQLFPDGAPSDPTAERTDLVNSIRQAVTQLRARPLVGVVLVSDGVDNTGADELPGLEESTVPVYTVGFQPDADASRLDLAVRGVQAPDRVMVNNEIKVDVSVSKTAGPEVEATVSIKRGQETLVTERVQLASGNAEQVVSVKFKPAQAGRFVYTASVAAAAGERLAANNAQHFPLQVDADAIRVFYLEGFLRYEYKFLKNRLEDDPDIALVSVVRGANPEQTGGAAPGNLFTPERLKDLEVVILGDMEGSFLSDQEYRDLVAWVDSGHALLVLGGYRSFGPQGFRDTPLADCLPVVFAQEGPFQAEDPFVLELTDKGKKHPMFEITGDRIKDATLWSGAPSLSGASLVARAKAGADVLAVDPSFVTADKTPAVVVASQRYGSGHTLAFCADTTWRWTRLARAAGQSDTLYARFWSQTIRWLARRELAGDRPPLVVSTDRPDYQVGKAVEVRAVRQPGADRAAAAGEVSVQVVDDSGKAAPVPMKASSTEPDVFVGSFYPRVSGRYRAQATLAAAGVTTANQSTEFLVQGSNLELADPAANPQRLQTIARLTGGAYYDIADVNRLPGQIERRERVISRRERTEFWNSPRVRSGLFVFFLAAITGEWMLRRRNHML